MGYLDKKRIIQENNVDIFIDDNFKNCKEASNLGVRTLLMDSRLNKNLNDEKIKRVFSWNDIERDLIQKIHEYNKGGKYEYYRINST